MSNIMDLKVYELARMADCGSPDSLESPGARFLESVRDAVAEAAEGNPENDDWSEEAAQIADDAPDVYTHQRWLEFVDLAAYQEDPTELGEISDMTAAAGICLYIIAERLAFALFELAAEGD